MWNNLVKIYQYPNISVEDKNMARLLIDQLKTASGTHFLRKEIDIFVDNMVSEYSDILIYEEDKLKKLVKKNQISRKIL